MLTKNLAKNVSRCLLSAIWFMQLLHALFKYNDFNSNIEEWMTILKVSLYKPESSIFLY